MHKYIIKNTKHLLSLEGFEPTTYALWAQCSTIEL